MTTPDGLITNLVLTVQDYTGQALVTESDSSTGNGQRLLRAYSTVTANAFEAVTPAGPQGSMKPNCNPSWRPGVTLPRIGSCIRADPRPSTGTIVRIEPTGSRCTLIPNI